MRPGILMFAAIDALSVAWAVLALTAESASRPSA
jgi:hypothetical protein